MDAGRRWAIEMFGAHGPQIREHVARIARQEHERCLDAQEASGHRNTSVYGQYWRGVLEQFEQFRSLPGGTLIRPGRAPYRIPVIHGVALFPWRYGDSGSRHFSQTRFSVSPAREALFALDANIAQGELGLEFTPPELSEQEVQLATDVERAMRDELVTRGTVVVVAIASSVSGLHDVVWGDAALGEDGCLQFGFSESLIEVGREGLLAVPGPDAAFDSGELPRYHLELQAPEGDVATGDVGDDDE